MKIKVLVDGGVCEKFSFANYRNKSTKVGKLYIVNAIILIYNNTKVT